MTEQEFFQRLKSAKDEHEAFEAALEFVSSGRAESVEMIEILKSLLEKGIVPQFDGDEDDYDGYDEWAEKNEDYLGKAESKVLKLLQKQGKYIAEDDTVSLEELERLYQLCFDDVLYATNSGPNDEDEARQWVREAFRTGKVIHTYDPSTGEIL